MVLTLKTCQNVAHAFPLSHFQQKKKYYLVLKPTSYKKQTFWTGLEVEYSVPKPHILLLTISSLGIYSSRVGQVLFWFALLATQLCLLFMHDMLEVVEVPTIVILQL